MPAFVLLLMFIIMKSVTPLLMMPVMMPEMNEPMPIITILIITIAIITMPVMTTISFMRSGFPKIVNATGCLWYGQLPAHGRRSSPLPQLPYSRFSSSHQLLVPWYKKLNFDYL